MKKLRVMTVVETRPEIIRLSRVITVLDQHCDHVLVHTGHNYDSERNDILFDGLELREPDFFLASAQGIASPGHTIGNLIINVDRILAQESPDAMLVLGDTNSCLAAIAAKRRKVSVFHMEAGNRGFDQRAPEEINRRIVDHTADINLTYSAIARDCLLREGLAPERVIKTGSPMYEVLHHYRPRIEASGIVAELGLTSEQYFVVSAHHEENTASDVACHRLTDAIRALAKDHPLPVIVTTHPLTRKQIDVQGVPANVRLMNPLGFLACMKLQMSARAVLSDSGTITEEAAILNFPVLNIREVHERPEGMEEGAVMIVGLDIDRIRQGLAILATRRRGPERAMRPMRDCAVENVSDRVLRVILATQTS